MFCGMTFYFNNTDSVLLPQLEVLTQKQQQVIISQSSRRRRPRAPDSNRPTARTTFRVSNTHNHWNKLEGQDDLLQVQRAALHKSCPAVAKSSILSTCPTPLVKSGGTEGINYTSASNTEKRHWVTIQAHVRSCISLFWHKTRHVTTIGIQVQRTRTVSRNTVQNKLKRITDNRSRSRGPMRTHTHGRKD